MLEKYVKFILFIHLDKNMICNLQIKSIKIRQDNGGKFLRVMKIF
jgi:hypothetical protein